MLPINTPPYDHYNYDDLEDCPCFLCVRGRKADKLISRFRVINDDGEIIGLMGRGYDQSAVPAWQYAEIHRRYTIDTNKRVLYCELSFITKNKKWRDQFLTWVLHKIEDPTWVTPGFWSNRVEVKSLGSWISDWLKETANPS